MIRRLRLLSEPDRDVFRATIAFAEKRLPERATIEWALGLGAKDTAKRWALLEVLNHQRGRGLDDPWRTAWRVLEESWEHDHVEPEESHGKYEVADRVRSGERTGSLVSRIVDLVRPYVKVAPLSKLDLHYRRVPRNPRNVQDLLSVSLESGEVVDPSEIALDAVVDVPFLLEVAHGLDAALTKGLDLGCRLVDYSEDKLWRIGDLKRAHFVPESDRAEMEDEPDQFNTGIAPAAKLLYAVVARLHDLDATAGASISALWKHSKDAIHVRLWSAVARSPSVATPADVGAFLQATNDSQFWDLHRFPEVAELRAVRFSSLSSPDQHAVIARLRRGPPSKHWPRNAHRERVAEARRYWSVRELRRIEVSGGSLEEPHVSWMKTQLAAFADLRAMSRIDEGFLGTSKASWIAPDPDERFDFLEGAERLDALEAALSSARGHWQDDPARRAADWLGAPGNAQKLVHDFEATEHGRAYPMVWDKFGWQHSPIPETDAAQVPSNDPTADRVISLLETLPNETAQEAIQGLTRWLDTWQNRIADQAALVRVWLRLWPIAVQFTDSEQAADEEPSLSVVVRASGREEPTDLDTLNTPAGRLVGVFLSACPSIPVMGGRPFDDANLRSMREAAIAATGRAGLIVRHRLIEQLAYFLKADSTWTKERLVEPLLEESDRSIVLWRAVARRTRFRDVLEIIGEPMALRASDTRLGRDSRRSLAFSVVVEALHALKEDREPAVSVPLVQQMLRSLDDEVRAHAANSVQRYVRDVSVSTSEVGAPDSPEAVFSVAAKPFLEEVWPQERSLSTPGVSRAFADLPYTCRECFAEAVAAVERFLVPFDAWSLMDYGLYGSSDERPKLSTIDTSAKAEALLLLLSSTISTSEDAVVPSDLATALSQIAEVSPLLRDSQLFRRLAALSRR